MGELLRQKAGLKNSLRGRPGNDLLNRTLTFVLDRLVDREKAINKDEDDDPSETGNGSDGNEGSNLQDSLEGPDNESPGDVKIVRNDLEKMKTVAIGDGEEATDDDKPQNNSTHPVEPIPCSSTSQDEWQTKEKPICKYWRRGKCFKKSDCCFRHPRTCPKFMKFGLSKYRKDTRGCEPNCSFLHPIICRNALRRGACAFENCKYTHTTSTTRIKPKQQQQPTTSPEGRPWASVTTPKPLPQKEHVTRKDHEPNQQPFLSVDHLLSLIRGVVQKEMGDVMNNGGAMVLENKRINPININQRPPFLGGYAP